MKIIKRNGSEADFDLNKIVIAVTKGRADGSSYTVPASRAS